MTKGLLSHPLTDIIKYSYVFKPSLISMIPFETEMMSIWSSYTL